MATTTSTIALSVPLAEAVADKHGLLLYRSTCSGDSTSPDAPPAEGAAEPTFVDLSDGAPGVEVTFDVYDTADGTQTPLVTYQLPGSYTAPESDEEVGVSAVLCGNEVDGGSPGDPVPFTSISSDLTTTLVELGPFADGGTHIATVSLEDGSITDLTAAHSSQSDFSSAPDDTNPRFVGGGPIIRFDTTGEAIDGAPEADTSGEPLTAETSVDAAGDVVFPEPSSTVADIEMPDQGTGSIFEPGSGGVITATIEGARASAEPNQDGDLIVPEGFLSGPAGDIAISGCIGPGALGSVCVVSIQGDGIFLPGEDIGFDQSRVSVRPPTAAFFSHDGGDTGEAWQTNCDISGVLGWIDDARFVIDTTEGPTVATIDMAAPSLECDPPMIPESDRANSDFVLTPELDAITFFSEQGDNSAMFRVPIEGGDPEEFGTVPATGTFLTLLDGTGTGPG